MQDLNNRRSGRHAGARSALGMAPHGPGNRLAYSVTTQALLSGTTTYAYDDADRLTYVDATPISYDNRGNQLGDGVWTYTYNAAGRMVRAETITATQVYTYNGDGLLVAQNLEGVGMVLTWDPALALPQVLATSNGIRALYGLERLGVVVGSTWFYPQHDAIGSVRQWTDALGAVVGMQGYAPFGELLVPLGPPPAPWGFTGEWQDPTGLVYLRARWYHPELGRFTQVDPVAGALARPGTWHAYAYGLNNTLLRTDPSGRGPIVIAALGITAIVIVGVVLWYWYWPTVPPRGGGSALSERLTTRGEQVAFHLERLVPPLVDDSRLEQVLPTVCPALQYYHVFRALQDFEAVVLWNWLFADAVDLSTKPTVSNPKLQNTVDELYRPGASVGSGSTADAIRHERATGQLVDGKSHIPKGMERVRNLQRILRTEKLDAHDRAVAEALLKDLTDALGSQ